MYVGHDFPIMAPDEDEHLAFDFVNDFLPTETITSVVWTLAVYDGTDAGVAGHLNGAPTNAGLVSSQRVLGLVDGVTYRIRCLATSNLGNKMSLHSFIKCLAPVGADT